MTLFQSFSLFSLLCLSNFLQVWFICNQIDQVPLFRYIIWSGEVYPLIRERKVIGDIKYLMKSVKIAVGAVGVWTNDHWDVKRVNLLYTMVSGRFIFKIYNSFDTFSWSSVVRDLYTRRDYITGILNEEQEQAWQAQKKRR